MKFRLPYFVLFLILTSPASATNFYFGVNAGGMTEDGDFSLNDSNPPTGSTSVLAKDYQAPDEVGLTYSLFAGYKLGSDIALEVGYAINEELEGDIRILNTGNGGIETVETSYIYAAFVGLWPVQGNWAFNARLGFAVWDINYNQTEVDTALLSTDANYIIQEQFLSDNASAMLLGVGISYGLSENIELKFNIENHFVDFSFTNLELEFDAVSITFGTAYHF